jgi:acyl carrier protein
MFTYTTLHNQIVTLFTEKLNVEIPSIHTDLLEVGILDSLSFVELLVHLEQEFGTKISLDDLEIEHFRSVAKIAEFVTHHKELNKFTKEESLLLA